MGMVDDAGPWRSLRQAFDDAPAVMAIFHGQRLELAYANPRFTELFGLRELGVPIWKAFPELAGQGIGELLRHVIKTGETRRQTGTAVNWVRADGTPVMGRFDVSWSALRDADDAVAGVVVVAVDVTAELADRERAQTQSQRADVAANRTRALQVLGTALSGAIEIEEVLALVVSAGVRLLGTVNASVALLDEQRRELRYLGTAGVEVRSLDDPVPTSEVARTCRPMFFADRAQLYADWDNPAVRGYVESTGEQAWIVLPLLAHDRLLGVLRLSFDHPRTSSPEERDALLTLAGQCALALERAQLFAAARAATQAVALSELRYRSLVEAISMDVWAADPAGELSTDMPAWRRITGSASVLGSRWLADVHPDDRDRVRADWLRCVAAGTYQDLDFRIRSAEGGWRVIASKAAPVRRDGRLIEWLGTTSDITDQRRAAQRSEALQRTGAAYTRAVTLPQVLTAVLSAAAGMPDAGASVLAVMVRGERLDVRSIGWPEPLGEAEVRAVLSGGRPDVHPTVLPDGTPAAAVLLPLVSAGIPLGVVGVALRHTDGLDASARLFLATFADASALAMGRARLFEQQRDVATVLQRALQPGAVPPLPGADACTHHATSEGVEVGGDWAELLPLPGDRVAVVLGDVMGRGVRAATLMATTRAAVRAYAVLDPEPAAVSAALDLLFDSLGGEELVTLHYGLLEPDGRYSYVSCGHLPPLHVPVGGPAGYLPSGGSVPLGVLLGEREVQRARLRAGDLLIVVSDGLVETKGRTVDEGMAALAVLAGSPAFLDPATALAVLCELAMGELGVDSDDDTTVLVLRKLS